MGIHEKYLHLLEKEMRILFATSNKHKIEEANEIGADYGIEFSQLKLEYPEIRDESVTRVAEEGVKYVYARTRKPVIVEDTGLYIKALEGFPGSYSAFVYDKIGNEGILALLQNKSDRSAEFASALGYMNSDGVRLFEGKISGKIINELRGSGGFGYDPIFIPEGSSKTFAENPEGKHRISHRGEVFRALCKWLVKN